MDTGRCLCPGCLAEAMINSVATHKNQSWKCEKEYRTNDSVPEIPVEPAGRLNEPSQKQVEPSSVSEENQNKGRESMTI